MSFSGQGRRASRNEATDMGDMRRRQSVAVQVDVSHDVSAQTIEDARKGTEEQKHMGLMEGLRRYPKACAWSMLLSTAIM